MTPPGTKPAGYIYIKAKCRRAYLSQFQEGVIYELILNKISFNGPISVIKPQELDYANIRAFRKDWEIQT